MLANLALGTVIISATVLFHTLGLVLLTRIMARVVRWFSLHKHDFGKSVAMVTTVLGLFLIHAVEIWMWAIVFLLIDAIASFQDALYFSTVSFSTVGYGDIIVGTQWRLLASLEAINGFLLIGWSTAYLVSASTRHGPFRLGEHF
jgi:voltage-gated potassium channel Kch